MKNENSLNNESDCCENENEKDSRKIILSYWVKKLKWKIGN